MDTRVSGEGENLDEWEDGGNAKMENEKKERGVYWIQSDVITITKIW